MSPAGTNAARVDAAAARRGPLARLLRARHDGDDLTEARMSADEVRSRARTGAAVVGGRAVIVQAVTMTAQVLVARMLVPKDFGVVAFGTTLLVALGVVTGPNLAAALVRQVDPPSRFELQALYGLQLVVTTVLAAAAAAVLWPFGLVGHVTALMLAGLPLMALRTPGTVILDRRLSYRPLALVDVTEAIAFGVWAVATVAAGWGVWGLASAAVVRAAVGSTVMAFAAPVGFLRPRLAWKTVRRLVGFGALFQAFQLLNIGREQGLNAGIAGVGGLGALGLWQIANKVLQIPFLLFSALWKVSFPAMSRLIAAAEDVTPTVERVIRLVAVATGAILVPLVGAAPALVPVVLGEQWRPAADILPWAAAGLMIGGPVSVAASGYLWAAGSATTPLRAIAAQGATWAAVALPLLPVIGVAAIGIGWMCASCAEAIVLGRRTHELCGARIPHLLVAPFVLALAAGAAGWAFATTHAETLLVAVAAAVAAEAVYVLGLALVRRALLFEVAGVTSRAFRSSFARAQ